ncbi:DUF3592 domain-containing protein [Luteolibacter ambystomatis]|uniref:DUF3592 domain-containing protein n=1 Tax=Luteolibacter ambystomatis TaxID=2824561 RepID=A0A975G9W2_9BACT|nr:DUF3592 domain-containing protein [Luteolibacter ambystomatis]
MVSTSVGLWLLVTGLKSVWTLRRARFWPKAAGRIVRARLSKYEDADGDIYGYTLEYVYQVDGHGYTGTEIFPGSSRTRHSRMNEYAGRFPEDAGVTVHYDPANPAFCLLETHPWILSNVCLVIAGGFCSFLGIAMLVAVPLWNSVSPCGCDSSGDRVARACWRI